MSAVFWLWAALSALCTAIKLNGTLEFSGETLFSGVQFNKLGIFPPTTLALLLLNNSMIDSPACRSELTSSITGPGWMDQLVDPANIEIVSFGLATPAPAVAGMNPTPIPAADSSSDINSTVGLSTQIILPITPHSAFNGDGAFTIVLVGNCTIDGMSPQPVSFSIVQGLRSTPGRVSTFVGLLACGISAAAALLGSPVALLYAQQHAVLSYNSCGPVTVQDEYEVLRFTIAPIDLSLPGWTQDESMLFGCIVLGIAFWVFDAVREAVTRLTGDSRLNVVEELEREKRVRSRSTVTIDESGAAADPNRSAVDLTRSIIVTMSRKGAHNPFHLPPTFGIVCHVGLINGVSQIGFRAALATGYANLFLVSIAVLAVVAYGPGTVASAMYVVRNKSIYWCPYTTKKAELHASVQPSGVWGPNIQRLRFGSLIAEYSKGKKGVAPLLLLLEIVIAVVGGVNPTSLQSCQWEYGLLIVFIGLQAILVVAVRPFRSLVHNWLAATISTLHGVAQVLLATQASPLPALPEGVV